MDLPGTTGTRPGARAQGVARQRQAIVNGLRDSILHFSNDVSDVSSKEVIEMMMVTQYFDMLRDIGSSNRRAPAASSLLAAAHQNLVLLAVANALCLHVCLCAQQRFSDTLAGTMMK